MKDNINRSSLEPELGRREFAQSMTGAAAVAAIGPASADERADARGLDPVAESFTPTGAGRNRHAARGTPTHAGSKLDTDAESDAGLRNLRRLHPLAGMERLSRGRILRRALGGVAGTGLPAVDVGHAFSSR
ncbi:hypothetical protein [Haladaptatus halobius]|uniref:hypothetical protein n=1 Tax=Haladaptatus halobius TaxID=2884875 RepID=UPI001D0A9C0F|nr:hypothetical protein [Haladaptatus halobius]